MENDRFDALTRAMSTSDSRRRTLRALGGTLLCGVLGGVAASLGLGEDAAAKGKRRQKGHKDHKRSGQVQAAGKHRKKHKHKHKHKNKDEKPQDPPQPRPPCGVGEKGCPFPESPSGWACVGMNDCCPGEKRCGDTCIRAQRCCDEDPYPICGPCDEVICRNGKYVCDSQCCPGQKHCPGYSECFAVDDCCPAVGHPPCGDCEKLVCEGGELICQSTCQGADATCCHGSCKSTTCPPGQEFDSETCQCQPAVCPHGSPDVCSNIPDDFNCGVTDYGANCYCQRSTAGETHCATPGWTAFECQTDAQCKQKFPGNYTFCNACNGTCFISVGCPSVDPA